VNEQSAALLLFLAGLTRCFFLQVLHVQSLSQWAPMSIGPYSQANCVANGVVFVAGMRDGLFLFACIATSSIIITITCANLSLIRPDRAHSRNHASLFSPLGSSCHAGSRGGGPAGGSAGPAGQPRRRGVAGFHPLLLLLCCCSGPAALRPCGSRRARAAPPHVDAAGGCPRDACLAALLQSQERGAGAVLVVGEYRGLSVLCGVRGLSVTACRNRCSGNGGSTDSDQLLYGRRSGRDLGANTALSWWK
jgi:hypothetical protein